MLGEPVFNQAIQRVPRQTMGLPITKTRSNRSAPYRFASTRKKPADSLPGSVVMSLSAMSSSAASQKRLLSALELGT